MILFSEQTQTQFIVKLAKISLKKYEIRSLSTGSKMFGDGFQQNPIRALNMVLLKKLFRIPGNSFIKSGCQFRVMDTVAVEINGSKRAVFYKTNRK